MEIKQGDKVRVSEDAPKMYLRGWHTIFTHQDCTVVSVEDGNAGIANGRYDMAIPVKYLVKVDAEAKEKNPKYHRGDRVVCNGYVGTIINDDDSWIADCGYWYYDIKWDDGTVETLAETELALYTEPTEQTEAEECGRIHQIEAELDELRKAELDRVLRPEKPTFEVTIDNVTMNWQRYEADLAKEVALKVTNKFNDPKEAAEYAVSVAKAVVKNLKQK